MPLTGIPFAAVGAYLPIGYIKWMRSRRMLKFEEQFPEAMDLLARALRAGHALTTGLAMVADELKDPIGPEFKTLYDEQNFGLPLPQALKNFAMRIPLLDARFFVTAVLTQRDAGGNLSEALGNLSRVLRERRKMRDKVSALSMEAKASAAIIGALPFIVATLVYLTSPDYIMILFTDPRGHLILGISGVWMSIGVLMMRNMINFDI